MNGRPLVWSDSDNSGMLLDPTVNQLNGTYVTEAIARAFQSA